jgi:hypothetical protein
MNSLENKNIRKEILWESQYKEKDIKIRQL